MFKFVLVKASSCVVGRRTFSSLCVSGSGVWSWSWLLPQISSLCLQAEGGKKAGAVATVVAAVDLARVRLPLADDDEEEAAEGGIGQQPQEITTEKHVVETKILGAGPPAAVSVTSDQRRVQVSQVRHLLMDITPVAAPVLIRSVDHSRSRGQKCPPAWTLPPHRLHFHILLFLKFLSPNTKLATR